MTAEELRKLLKSTIEDMKILEVKIKEAIDDNQSDLYVELYNEYVRKNNSISKIKGRIYKVEVLGYPVA